MKLLYITNGINGAGGLERVLSVKASLLAEEYGYDVTILSLNNAHLNPFYKFSSKIKMLSIPVNGNVVKYWLSYKKGIQKIVNKIQPDIISVCDDGLKAFFVPSFLRTKAKIIYERHASIYMDSDTSLKSRFLRFIMQRQATKFEKFIVLTEGNAKEWKSSNVMVIPNPLGFRSEAINPLNQKRIIAVGSHSLNKGYDTLLEIWKELGTQFPDWRLDIFGKVDRNQTYEKKAQELYLKNVQFYNPVKDIQSEYEKSSVLVLPSRSEGFGMVIIEAMTCGVPCVAFDCPSGPADIISNGKDGFLVENQNKKQFVQKLSLFLKNEALRQIMGKEAKQSVKRYLPENIIKQWEILFKNLK